MARSVNARKWREWQRRMKRFENTRQSAAEFCREEGIAKATFYQWRKRLAAPPPPEHRQEGEPIEAKGGFTPVRLVATASVAVHLPGGTQLHLPTSDSQALRLVVATLARIDARRAGGGPC